jgi:uncharacterized membrane protein
MHAPSELLAIVFQGETRAGEVLAVVNQLHHEGAVDLHNAAVITRDAAGRIAIHETNDFTPREGALGGTVLGGLIGLLRGKLLGDALLGAGAGYVASKVLDLGFNDAFLNEIAATLTPNTSALVLAIEFERLNEALRVLDPYHGTILRQTLPPEQARKLAAAMEGAN